MRNSITLVGYADGITGGNHSYLQQQIFTEENHHDIYAMNTLSIFL
jgi:hypothetical protein